MPSVLRLPVAAAPLLEDACEQFLAECRLRGLSPRTVTWHSATLRPFLRYAVAVGCERTDEVAEAHVRAFLANRQAEVEAGRANQYRGALRTFFAWALEGRHKALNPAARLRKVRGLRRVIATVNEADLEALLAQSAAGLPELTGRHGGCPNPPSPRNV